MRGMAPRSFLIRPVAPAPDDGGTDHAAGR